MRYWIFAINIWNASGDDKDFSGLDLGDIRRNERFVAIINSISTSPGSSIPQQNCDWYDTKATYEFYKNDDISIDALRSAISSYGRQLIKEEQVLIAHDFCQISYNDSAAEGLGYLANAEGKGIITYNSIAISNTGVPLSLVYQNTFIRKEEDFGKAKKRRVSPFEDKESYNWYKGITAVNTHLGEGIHKIHIADREADIYELFFCAYETNTDLLIRARHNRRLSDRSALWDAVSELEPAAKTSISIPDNGWTKRVDIDVEVRFHQVEILRPDTSKNEYRSIKMTAVERRQVSPKMEWQKEQLH